MEWIIRTLPVRLSPRRNSRSAKSVTSAGVSG
ncbi:hypothetical protein Rrhod_1572 [Rhodococcus rhodnii LMG 5362]|uniref:Uncharacterized protein n=1 Tax=Rhodococcus rhodnii LMG 5362 TaxID=1273125 RepID=R7WP96_9NOCA|nr:hypothetical protein Rrhod_1572 [Rhodococcus rhodnii LMG 5362]